MPNAEESAIISVENLTKTFKDFWNRPKVHAVDGLSFRVKRGEVVGLLGPNGSGKSTTIKMLLNLLYPTAGQLKIFGKSVEDVQVKSRIGYLPEETYLYNFLSVEETLIFFGQLFSLSRREAKERGTELLELFGMTDARKRKISELSKGMARRIGVAQALINNPDLLILDEPTSGLDPIACNEVKRIISFLKNRGKTVFVSSHLLSDIEEVCDRIIILYGGKIVSEGQLAGLLKVYEKSLITIPRQGTVQIEQIEKFFREELKISDISIDSPNISLEKYFIKIMDKSGAGTPGTNLNKYMASYLG